MSIERPSTDNVADRIKSYAEAPDSTAIHDEVNELLSTYRNITVPAERAKIADGLRDSGVLPGLALVEHEKLDVLGDNDGVKMDDLEQILANPETYDPTLVLTADYVKQNFDRIEDTSFHGAGDTLDPWEFEYYAEEYEKGDEEAAPELRPWKAEGEEEAWRVDVELPAEERALASDLDDLLSQSSPDPQKVFAVLEQLAKLGATEVTLHDVDGAELKARIAMEAVAPGSSRQYLHLFAPDETGVERIALRAIAQDGVYSQQRDSSGRLVGFVGDRFARSEQIKAEF